MTNPATAAFRLFLVRHAHSGWALPGMRDFDRPLDARGRGEAARLARILAVNGYAPRRIVCSPAPRCAETLDLLALAPAQPTCFDPGLYSGALDTYLAAIAAHAPEAGGALMLIGHNPMLEETAHALLADDAAARSGALAGGFPTAGLLVVDCPAGAAAAIGGGGRFVGLLSPRDG